MVSPGRTNVESLTLGRPQGCSYFKSHWGRIYFLAYSCGCWQNSFTPEPLERDLPPFPSRWTLLQSTSQQGSLLHHSASEKESERDEQDRKSRSIATESLDRYFIIHSEFYPLEKKVTRSSPL